MSGPGAHGASSPEAAARRAAGSGGARPVGVEAVGLVTPWGVGVDAAVRGWREQRCALALNDRWPTDWFVRADAGLVPPFKARKLLPDRKAIKLMAREALLMTVAAVEAGRPQDVEPAAFGAFAAAGYEVSSLGETEEMLALSRDGDVVDVARLFGPGRDAYNPLAPLKVLPNMGLFHVAAALDAQGPQLALGSSPAAGLIALGEACDALRYGEAEAAVAVAGDANVEVFRAHLMVEAGVAAALAPAEGGAAVRLGGGGVRVRAWGAAQESAADPEPRAGYGRVVDAGVRRSLVEEVVGDGTPDLVFADLWGVQERDALVREGLGRLGERAQGTAELIGWTGAAAGLIDAALAAALIEAGEARSALILAAGLAGDLAAVWLEAA